MLEDVPAVEFDAARRFGGIERLYGPGSIERLAQACVVVVGIGGVGSWVVEALARSGVGHLVLVDLDHVAESNFNRQIHAQDSTLGQAKIEAMAARVRSYHPLCRLDLVDEFVSADNVAELLAGHYHYVVDAIDNVRAKAALIHYCRYQRIPVLTCGAAGGQTDPTQIRIDDLTRTLQDPLLAKVRARLRKEYAYPGGGGKKFGVDAVYSLEPVRQPLSEQACALTEANFSAGAGLNCAGFGSSVSVTGAFGLAAASRVIRNLCQ